MRRRRGGEFYGGSSYLKKPHDKSIVLYFHIYGPKIPKNERETLPKKRKRPGEQACSLGRQSTITRPQKQTKTRSANH